MTKPTHPSDANATTTIENKTDATNARISHVFVYEPYRNRVAV